MWHDNNIQWNTMYRYVLRTQFNRLASLAKWLSVHLWTKWLWVWAQLQSLKLQILRLLWARSSLTFRELQSVGSFWNAYVKLLLRKQWKTYCLNCEEMQAVLKETEAISNNRPLSYVYPTELETCITQEFLLLCRTLSFSNLNQRPLISESSSTKLYSSKYRIL